MIEKRCSCGEELYVEAPPFEQMSNKDIEEWKQAGGRVMVLCKECGKEDKPDKEWKPDWNCGHVEKGLCEQYQQEEQEDRYFEDKMDEYICPECGFLIDLIPIQAMETKEDGIPPNLNRLGILPTIL